MRNPWVLASRPKTLLAGIAPVITGAGIAIYSSKFSLLPAVAALLGAVLIQIGANFANDVADFQRGADTTERLGPLRVTQAGLLTPRQVQMGMWVSFGLATLIGLYLFSVAGWPVVFIGVLSILAGIAYTGGPIPLGYYGFGDLMVFIFFGPAAVIGTYYVQALSVEPLAAWMSVPLGTLTTAILVVNNLRDIDTDRDAGKKTLAVRIGPGGTRLEYAALLGIAYAIPVYLFMIDLVPWTVFLILFSSPMAVNLIRQVYRDKGQTLNQVLAKTGQLEFLYACLFALGLFL